MNPYYLLIPVIVILNTTANLLIKKGASSLHLSAVSLPAVITFVLSIFTNFFVMFGLFLFGTGFFIWVLALSKIQVSIAAPLMSVSYVFIAIFAAFFLGESITLTKIIGISVIILGIIIITR